uniref:Uncharacterized protein n=1 Tax=Setaria viridis TaxID=4556 RepID=A0A4U6UBA0_SETVI|nr:hypothetical protein SEVIR_7G315566v2 [Setaria viridis]
MALVSTLLAALGASELGLEVGRRATRGVGNLYRLGKWGL